MAIDAPWHLSPALLAVNPLAILSVKFFTVQDQRLSAWALALLVTVRFACSANLEHGRQAFHKVYKKSDERQKHLLFC